MCLSAVYHSLHSTHSLTPLAVFCHRRPLRVVQMVIMWTAPLTDQWTTISGVTAEKKYRPIPILPNTCKYRPIPNNPIPVSFEPYLPYVITVSPAVWQKWTHPALTPAKGWYSIYLPQRDGRLSSPRWPVTCWDGWSCSWQRTNKFRLNYSRLNYVMISAGSWVGKPFSPWATWNIHKCVTGHIWPKKTMKNIAAKSHWCQFRGVISVECT